MNLQVFFVVFQHHQAELKYIMRNADLHYLIFYCALALKKINQVPFSVT